MERIKFKVCPHCNIEVTADTLIPVEEGHHSPVFIKGRHNPSTPGQICNKLVIFYVTDQSCFFTEGTVIAIE